MSNQNNSSSENIKCVVRCRPLNSKEKGLGAKCITISADSKVVIVENKDEKNQTNKGKYAMDRVFDETVTQEELFLEIGEPILKNFIGGYNCTIFCYGQTGAGKTHTMMGPLDQLFEEVSESHGLIPRIIHYIFNEKEKVYNIITNNTTEKCKNIKYQVKTCVMEIYQEQIIDLLSNNQNKKDPPAELKIKEDPKKGMYIQGITEAEVLNAKEAKSLILSGLKSRHVAATEMNAESSRSHLLFSIYLNAQYIDQKNGEVKKSSRLHLIDLAGSERQKKTKAVGERIKEACMINKSLSTLGNVINALVEVNEGKGKYIPFRDSKLTYFLKDSLGGNSKTTIVANISCSLMQVGETISTLKFVQRAKMIKNSVSLNVSVQENIETLHAEIKKLKEIIAKGGICDLSLLDGEKKNEDYICPICHNQPIEVSQEQAMSALKNDIMNLTEAIVKNFAVGDELKKQFLTLDTEFGKSGIKFFDLVDQYKSEYEKKLKDLDGQVKLLNEFYDEAKDGMNEANKKINNYKPTDPMDRLTFEKVNNLNNTTAEIVKKFKQCDIEQLNKLQRENQALKKEIEISTEVKKILEEKEKNKNKENMTEKEKLISDCVDKFIKSNNDIKNFMSEHFLGQPMLKNELVFLEKSKYDLLLFQLDEEKLTNNSLRKQIEDMESENYLINMELSNMKNQLDNFNNIKSKGRLSICGNLKPYSKQNDEEKRSANLKVSKSIKRLSTRKLDVMKDENINVNEKETSIESNNINLTKDYEDPNKKNVNSISNKLAAEIIKMKESLEEINNDLEEKIFENDELQGKILALEEEINKLNIKVESEQRNNIELKEQIESLYTENELYEQQIFDLIDFKKKTGLQIVELSNDINNQFLATENVAKSINEIFDLYQKKCNELFEKNKNFYIQQEKLDKELEDKKLTIENLNNKCEIYKTFMEENNKSLQEINELCEENNKKVNSLFNDYQSKIKKIILFYNLNLDKNKSEINEIINLFAENNNKTETLFENYNNEIKNIKSFYNKNLDNINHNINEIVDLCNKNNTNINNLFDNYNNEMEKLKKFYNVNIDGNNNIINEIIELCDKNNDKINNLFENHKSEIEKIIKFYNSSLDKNSLEIKDILKLCDENQIKVNNLYEIYKNEIQNIIQFYNKNLDKNNKEINEIIKLCDGNNSKMNDLFKIFNNNIEKIQQYYKNVYINYNNFVLKKIDEINNGINEQINNLNKNDNNINSLINEMKDVINTLLIKLDFKEKAINKLKKEKEDLTKEKIDSDKKNIKTIDEMKEDINKYKNRLFIKDNIIKTHLDYEINIKNTIDEILQQISDNDKLVLKLNQKYNEDLTKFSNFYNNIILFQNKNTLKLVNNNDITIDEIKLLLKNNENEVDNLYKEYKELNDKYFDKCCSLLNNISNQDINNKSLNNKISTLETYNNKLIEEKNKLEEENISLNNDKKNIENLNKVNIENNNKLKKNLENSQTQINNLNEEILNYIEQLKTKDDLINEMKNEKNKLNLQMKEFQNETNNLRNNIENKNELIKSLQEKINKNNSMLEEYNKKNLNLLKEIEDEKKKNDDLKTEMEEKENKINLLNEKMSKLFNEITNKDKIINQNNQEQIEMSKNLNEINESKNCLLSKINEKEKEIIDLQKNNDEINNKFMDINEQNNSLLNECQNKSNEINNLNETIKNNNNLLKSKDEVILKLNKKLKSKRNQILFNNLKNNKNNLIIEQPIFTQPNGGNLQFFDTKYEIDFLKERNTNLYNNNLAINENQNKLNMKYNVTKVLMNLGAQLIKEFDEYKLKNKNGGKIIEEEIDIFINEKIDKCEKEIKNNQNNLNQKIIEKKKLNGKLLNEVKNYNEKLVNKYNKYIYNLSELLKIFNQNEENNIIPVTKLIKEILDDLNQYKIFETNIEISNNDKKELININDLKEIIEKLKSSIENKKEIIIDLIPKIFESYNILVKEELKADNQINYYQYQKQILIDKKTTNDDLDKFITEYTNQKNTIILLKEKYNKLKEDFQFIKEKFSYNENIYSNQIDKELTNMKKNGNEEEKNNDNLSLEETNDEDDEDYQKILNEKNTLKNNILNKKNSLNNFIEKEENNKNIKEIYDNCKNIDFNFIDIEKNINTLVSSRDNIQKSIDDLKLNFLILNTLPSQYQIYKVFINHEALKEKNRKLEQKLKLVFGMNFNINYIYNDEAPEIIWRQEEIPKLTSEIMILREEKHKLENDYNALKAAFDLALKGNGNDSNQLILLFKIKEENKKLKKEIHQIKEKNTKLEEKLKELNYNNEILNSTSKNLKINDFIGINNSLNGNSILSINDVGNNHNISNSINFYNNHNQISKGKVTKDDKKPNIKRKLMFSDARLNSNLSNGSKEIYSDYNPKSKKKLSNLDK